MTNLDDAGRDIAEMLRLLIAKMRAKGWENPDCRLTVPVDGSRRDMHVYLEAAPEGDAQAFADPLGQRIRYAFAYGETLSEIFAEADKKIALMLDHPTEALAPWFIAAPEIADAAE
jgi:hypothetical protein